MRGLYAMLIAGALCCSACGCGAAAAGAAAKPAVSADAVRASLLASFGSHTVELLDRSYWSPGRAWAESALRAYRASEAGRQFSLRWDCNKRARAAQVFLARRYRDEASDCDPEGVAAFLQAHRQPGRDGHAVLAVLIGGQWRNYDALNGAWTDAPAREVWYTGD